MAYNEKLTPNRKPITIMFHNDKHEKASLADRARNARYYAVIAPLYICHTAKNKIADKLSDKK